MPLPKPRLALAAATLACALAAPAAALASPTGPAGGDLTGTYPNPTIAAGKVTTSKLHDHAVTGPKIADYTITWKNIAWGTIGGLQMENHGIGNLQVADAAVDNRVLADGAVTTTKIANGTITPEKLSFDAVGANQLRSYTVTFSPQHDLNPGDCEADNVLLPGAVAGNAVFASIQAPSYLDQLSISETRAEDGYVVFQTCNVGNGGHSHIYPVTARVLLA